MPKMKDEFGNTTKAVKCDRPGCGEYHPVPVAWKECQCGYLPQEDRECCTKHGTNAKPQPQSEPGTQPRPRRVVSVGRTQPLYDVTVGSSALDKIEDIVNRAIMEGELTIKQRGIMRWALRKCRRIMTKLREEFESL